VGGARRQGPRPLIPGNDIAVVLGLFHWLVSNHDAAVANEGLNYGADAVGSLTFTWNILWRSEWIL
jgi:hypothetical protein